MLFLGFPGGEIELPVAQKGIPISIEEGAPDILSEDTSILVFNEKMLLQARPQLIVAGMGAEPDNTVRTMRGFPFFQTKGRFH